MVNQQRGSAHKYWEGGRVDAGELFAQVGTGRRVQEDATHTKGRIVAKKSENTRLEGIMCGTRNTDRVTKNLVGACGRTVWRWHFER